jgi:hypothetical protein
VVTYRDMKGTRRFGLCFIVGKTASALTPRLCWLALLLIRAPENATWHPPPRTRPGCTRSPSPPRTANPPSAWSPPPASTPSGRVRPARTAEFLDFTAR